jgi:hypothetical protein
MSIPSNAKQVAGCDPAGPTRHRYVDGDMLGSTEHRDYLEQISKHNLSTARFLSRVIQTSVSVDGARVSGPGV